MALTRMANHANFFFHRFAHPEEYGASSPRSGSDQNLAEEKKYSPTKLNKDTHTSQKITFHSMKRVLCQQDPTDGRVQRASMTEEDLRTICRAAGLPDVANLEKASLDFEMFYKIMRQRKVETCLEGD